MNGPYLSSFYCGVVFYHNFYITEEIELSLFVIQLDFVYYNQMLR